MWQDNMERFMRIPHATATPAQAQRRQQIETTIETLEHQLRILSVEGGGALLLPEGLSLAPTSLARRERPMTEAQRIKMLQNGPPVI